MPTSGLMQAYLASIHFKMAKRFTTAAQPHLTHQNFKCYLFKWHRLKGRGCSKEKDVVKLSLSVSSLSPQPGQKHSPAASSSVG